MTLQVKEGTVAKVRLTALEITSPKNVKWVRATLVAKRAQEPLDVVESILSQMVDKGSLTRKYELSCQNEDCLHELDIVNKVEDFKSEYTCDRCGEETESVNLNFVQALYAGVR